MSLLLDLAEALGVGVAELLTGEYAVNHNRSEMCIRDRLYTVDAPLAVGGKEEFCHGNYSTTS